MLNKWKDNQSLITISISMVKSFQTIDNWNISVWYIVEDTELTIIDWIIDSVL